MVDDVMKNLQGMVEAATVAQVVQQVVVAYDNVAVAALCAVLAREGNSNFPYESSDARVNRQVSEAWKLADAWMVERAKRGLGRPPASP